MTEVSDSPLKTRSKSNADTITSNNRIAHHEFYGESSHEGTLPPQDTPYYGHYDAILELSKDKPSLRLNAISTAPPSKARSLAAQQSHKARHQDRCVLCLEKLTSGDGDLIHLIRRNLELSYVRR